MAKKVLIGLLVIAVLAGLYRFCTGVVSMIRMFESIDSYTMRETPYPMQAPVSALHVQSGQQDTIALKGKQIIHLWASWCRPCLEELPAIHRLAHQLDSVPLLLCSFDSAVLRKSLLDTLQVRLPVYLLTDTLAIQKPPLLPTTLLMNGNVVQDVLYGAQEWGDTLAVNRIRRFLRQ